MADELAITKIAGLKLRSHWITPEGWALMKRVKPGEMMELTSLIPDEERTRTHLNVKATSLRTALKMRNLISLKVHFSGGRLFVYYPEPSDAS